VTPWSHNKIFNRTQRGKLRKTSTRTAVYWTAYLSYQNPKRYCY